MTHYDYIVIDAGSAGSVVANRLTEDHGTTVLLLEAGNPDTKPEIQIPAECFTLLGSEVDWGYFPPGTQTPPHRHTRYFEQLYVLEGEFTVWVGKNKVVLGAGESDRPSSTIWADSFS